MQNVWDWCKKDICSKTLCIFIDFMHLFFIPRYLLLQMFLECSSHLLKACIICVFFFFIPNACTVLNCHFVHLWIVFLYIYNKLNGKKLQLCSLYSQVNDTTLIWILYVKLCRVFDAGTFAVKFIQILNSMSNSCIIALSTVEEIFP